MGMKIYTHGVEVVVPGNRRRAARRFIKRRKRRIYLQREPDSGNDPAAIRVIGKSKGWFTEVQKCIGYVPADITERLINGCMEDKVKARLQMIAIEDRDSIDIRFNLLGPQDDYERYHA